ncbi:hypothetical protein K1719_001329 [Acacia pycnantha]|nr:hypothetical protein K1719_001329 [Acacia pycnantha]
MSKSWKGSTEPDIEKSDSFANYGPQFSGDTEVRTREKVPLKKLCQRGCIMIGTIPVQLQPPYSMNLQGSSSHPSLNFSSTSSNISRHQGKSSFPNHLWKNSEHGYVKRPRAAQRNLNTALAGYKLH